MDTNQFDFKNKKKISFLSDIDSLFEAKVDDFTVIRNKSKAQLDIEKLEKTILDAQNQIQKLKENI